ncbi:MAG: bacillithiol system redox-active protein YtxJ [Candidatus Hydrogenedentales bacterium]
MNELTSVEDLHKVVEESRGHAVILFKHSTACPISARAARRVHEYVEAASETAPPFYLIKVIESRKISDAVATELGVDHESPQILLVRDGKAVWNTSHSSIRAEAIDAAIAQHAAPAS